MIARLPLLAGDSPGQAAGGFDIRTELSDPGPQNGTALTGRWAGVKFR